MLFHIKFIIQSYTSLVEGSVLLACLLKYIGYLIKSQSNQGWSILCSVYRKCNNNNYNDNNNNNNNNNNNKNNNNNNNNNYFV